MSTTRLIAGLLILSAAIALAAGGVLQQTPTVLPQSAAADPAPKAREAEDRPGDDRTALTGTWESTETVTRFVAGKQLPPEQQKTRWVITADKIVWADADGFVQEEYQFKIDSSKRPKTIDLTSRRVGSFTGIYRLEKDTITICLGFDGRRPTAFPEKAAGCWVLRRVSREPARFSQRYATDAGCFWMSEPAPIAVSSSTLGITYLFDKQPDGAALITVAYSLSAEPGEAVREYRPVLFDAGKKRYVPAVYAGGSSARRGGPVVVLRRWRMDPKVLPANKVALVGIEAVTAESHRVVAREAAQRARKAGVEVLPWPQVGEPFPFTLTTIDGRKLRSEDFKGKVVVIDCWATWCAPCMALLPKLKRLHERWHKDGLEIVGVSLDQGADKVRKTVKTNALPWPQVLAPTQEEAAKLWSQAAGIESIPRVFVIGPDGVLRADTPANLEEEIAKLLKAKGR